MVCHQTISVDYASRRLRLAVLILKEHNVMKLSLENEIILLIFEDVLSVNSSEHHMIDA